METRIIKFGDQDWKVTPFHCVVGDINGVVWKEDIAEPWQRHMAQNSIPHYAPPLLFIPQAFVYVTQRRSSVEQLRKQTAIGYWVLFFTNDPLVVNEMQPEEVTLACIDNDKLVLTNFRDLPNIEDGLKVYHLGEYWLSYAVGGNERCLRFGGPRP